LLWSSISGNAIINKRYNSTMVKHVDTVINARWVVPVIPVGMVLEHYAVVLAQGRMVDICPIAHVSTRYQANETYNLSTHALIPGLINLHTHAAMTLMRGLADDLPLMPWLKEHIWPTEQRFVSHAFAYDGSILACAEMLSGGITTFNDMYFFPEATIEAASLMGMRANIGLVVLGLATAYASDARSYMVKGTEVRDRHKANPLLSFSFAPHAPYSLRLEEFEQVSTLAEQLGLGVHTHMHETRHEIETSVRAHGLSPLLRFANSGLLSANVSLAHCVHLTEAEMERLQAFGCHIAHCPTSNLKLASGIAPVASCLAKGINVGLGTDGAASNNRLDMLAEMRLAALLAKAQHADATAIPAQQALAMATINGAKALGLDDETGSIEIGKLADLTAINLVDWKSAPCFEPLSHLVYVAGREQVTHVWVNGILQYHQSEQGIGMFNQIEPEALQMIGSKWQAKLSEFKR